ncbi:MAG: ATP-binding protein [Candidatus Nanopelagicales bacterium]
MTVRLATADLDRLAPFGMLVDDQGVVRHVGPSLRRICPDLEGGDLLEHLEVVRPLGLADLDGFRTLNDALVVLRVRALDLPFRFQVVASQDPAGLLLVGTPVVATSEELERRGLSAQDFSPVDQTPDLLLLRRGQERSLRDLRALNVELSDTARDLRSANRALARAEGQYRRLVELQPLVMYVDRLGATPVAEFMSPRVEEWLGYPLRRWNEEPGFFFSILHPDDRARVWDAHLRAEQTEMPFDLEFRVIAADGRSVWTRAVDSVVRDEDDPVGKRIGFMLDIDTAKTAELELRETMTRLTTLLTHMQAGVLVEDAQRRVVMVNDTLCGLFRATVQPSSLAGLPATAAVSQLVQAADDPAAFLRRTEDLLARRWPAVAETMELADGRVLEFDFQPIVDDGRDLGALWMFRDVTSRVQYEDALARARDEAIAASDAKSQFLASMSHEIRTPMHGVLATIDLLQTTPLDPEQRELIDVVSGSAAALVEIINDILDLQKVESGRIELADEAFCLRGLSHAVVDLLTPQARGKGLDLALHLDPSIPAQVVGDPLRLRQVLLNLAGNAVKFTSSGSVLLDVRWTPSTHGDGVLDIAVRDTGAGIPEDRLADIFDPFVQARRGQEGSGLGLAIADRLVGLMGGRLQVDSVVSHGTTFRFQLRMHEAVLGEQADAPPDAAPAPAPGDRIVLVVDRSPASRGLLMRQLARIGVPARAVASGEEALDALTHGAPYGLVLVDVGMPGLDGPATTAAIRLIPDRRTARLPVIGLVAGDSLRDRELCRDGGMEGHLAKPVDIGELRMVVDRWLGAESERSLQLEPS